MNADTTAKCAYLFDAMKKYGVCRLVMEFYGGSDDGQLEFGNIIYNKELSQEEEDEIWDSPTIFCWGEFRKNFKTLGELANEISGSVIDIYDIDYCNNEGNSGSILFDVETGRISTLYRVYETKEESLYI